MSKSAADVNRERVVVASLLQIPNGELPPNLQAVLRYAPEGFTDQHLGAIAAAIQRARVLGQTVDIVSVGKLLFDEQHTAELCRVGNWSGGFAMETAEIEAGTLLPALRTKRTLEVLDGARREVLASPENAEAIAQNAFRSLAETSETPIELAELLEKRRFNLSVQPPDLRLIYTLAGQVIATPGNLVAVTSAVKTGKSAVIGAMLGAVMPHAEDADLLGFASSNPKALALLHFDSEQSPDDHWHGNFRALKRAGLAESPAWFHSYCLTGLGFRRAMECIQAAVKAAADNHGGIHSILIDGIADLVADVNDAAESNAFVAERHGEAIEFDCPIIGVIHFNPGSEKTRGHLGSQFERKAETNLRLDKNEDTTEIWSDKQRRAPIPRGTGPCFAWDDQARMHVSVASRQDAKTEKKRAELSVLVAEVFAKRPAMVNKDLRIAIEEAAEVSTATANRKIADMMGLKLIAHFGAGLYQPTR